MKNFLYDFVCVITDNNCTALTFGIHSTFLITIADDINLGFVARCVFDLPDILR